MSNSGFDLSSSEIISNVEWTINRLEESKIKINKTSRLYKFYDDYLKLTKERSFPDNFYEILIGMRDFMEIWSIVKCGKIMYELPRDVKKILKGNRKPSMNINDTARNYQYQLFLTSLFINSNLSVNIEEPDFTFEYDKQRFSVAVKRLNSDGIENLLNKAENQILKYSYDGFIALSIDYLAYYSGDILMTGSPDILNSATQQTILSLVKNYFKPEFFLQRNKKVKGLILTLGLPSFSPNDLNLGLGYGFRFEVFPLPDPTIEKQEFDRIGRLAEKIRFV